MTKQNAKNLRGKESPYSMGQRYPELSIEQAMPDYKRLGYTDNWINQRLKSIEIRKDLTDEMETSWIAGGYSSDLLSDRTFFSN